MGTSLSFAFSFIQHLYISNSQVPGTVTGAGDEWGREETAIPAFMGLPARSRCRGGIWQSTRQWVQIACNLAVKKIN